MSVFNTFTVTATAHAATTTDENATTARGTVRCPPSGTPDVLPAPRPARSNNPVESPVAGRLRLIAVTEMFSIGQLARTTGLPVRTVRFWSDLGLVPPAGRTSGNYRMYDAEAAARLDLV